MINKDVIFNNDFMSESDATEALNSLMNIEWHSKRLIKSTNSIIEIDRKMAYMSADGSDYEYAGMVLNGTKLDNQYVIDIMNSITKMYGYNFNSVLLNLYKNGRDQIRWHSDNEPILGDNPVIAMVSLGATRGFNMRNKDRTSPDIIYKVGHGSILIMLENCQKNWLHAILQEKNITEPRVSLTFRLAKP